MLRGERHHRHKELTERMREVQAVLLKAFCNLATTNNKRLEKLENNQAPIISRLATLEGRTCKIEKRLNLPTAA